MHKADPPAFSLSGMNVPNKSESRGPHLNSLEEFILPVYLLETDNVVVLNELPEIVEFELSFFCEEQTQRDSKCSK